MRTILFVLIILVVPVLAHAATLKVPSKYPTIQDAIDAAVKGDTVLVAPGTYVENIDFKGKAITVTSEQGAAITVIDGNQVGSVVAFQSGESSTSYLDGFTLTNGTGTLAGYSLLGGGIYFYSYSPTITNNTISGNTANYSGNGGHGGGIYCEESSPIIVNNTITGNVAGDPFYSIGGSGGGIFCTSSSPTIMNNIITCNRAGSDGGGIHCGDNSDAIIKDNIISVNSSTCGGGISCNLSSTVIYKNTITGNAVGSYIGGRGGGIYCAGSNTIIVSNVISMNEADGYLTGWASGIYCASDAMICNNIITWNYSGGLGGGIYVVGSTPDIINNNISNNDVYGSAGGIYCDFNASITITNSILWDNFGIEIYLGGDSNDPSNVTISYSDVDGGHSSCHVNPGCSLNWGSGMIDADPLFADSANIDFHLTYTSPCKDTGDNSAVTELYDFEGDPRIAYGTVDMGSDEFYTHLYWTGDATPGGSVELKFVGLPGTSPVGLCIGSGVLDPPIKSMWGDWYLRFPILGPIDMPPIPSPDGVLVFPFTFPANTPMPLSLPFQAGIGLKLSNLSVMEAE